MRLLSLNVRAGGGNRWPAILDFVARRNPDVVIFSEWRLLSASEPAEAWARAHGFQWFAACDGLTANGVALAGSSGFRGLSLTPGRESAGTILRAEFDEWVLLACYFPQGKVKSRYFDVCNSAARSGVERPLLIAGDLNTGNQLKDKTPTGVKFACADRFDQLTDQEGLVDLWRLTHGAEAREWTWRTSRNGFRIDHALANSAFVRRFNPTCRYDHSSVEDGLTDHSALIVEF